MPNIVTTARTAWIVAASLLVAGCALFSSTPPDEGTGPDTEVEARVPPRPELVAPPPPRPRPDVASWYGEWHHGRPTASGEVFDMAALTAAHRSIPLGACVEVQNLKNGRRVFVRVNDRGPYQPGRTIDLSYGAAQALDMVETGVTRVRLQRAKPEACDASTD
jgi:rare lipoprotein A